MIPIIIGASGYEIWKSADLGESWNKVHTIASGFITGYAIYYAGNGVLLFGWYRGDLLRSDDYGDTWSVVQTMPSSVTSFCRIPGTSDLLAGVVNPANAIGDFYKSSDEGLTWTYYSSINVPTGESRIDVLVECDTDGSMLCGMGSNSADTEGRIFKSVDGGLTWSQSYQFYSYPTAEDLIRDGTNIGNNVYLFTNTVSDSDAGIARTTDEGDNWVFTANGSLYNRSLQGIDKRGNAFRVIGTSLEKTSDYGETWDSKLSVSSSTTLHGAAGNLCVAYAANLNAYRSVDGGDTWSSLATLAPISFTNLIAFVDPPYVSGVDVTYLYTGQLINISGLNFGSSARLWLCGEENPESVDRVEQTIGSQSETSISATIDTGSLGGNVWLYVEVDSMYSEGFSFFTISDTYTGRVQEAPIEPGSLVIKIEYAGSTTQLTDDGLGNIIGDGVGTVRYDIGKISFFFFESSPVPVAGTPITVSYVPQEGKPGWVLTNKIKLDIVPGTIAGQSELAVNDAWIRLLDKIRDNVLPRHVELIGEQYSESYVTSLTEKFDITVGDTQSLDSNGLMSEYDNS